MDADAYLRSHGWRGHGHSLDQSNRGITKPLLISKKVDVLGVGLNKHKAVSDQWWMRAFDQGLKSLGTGQQTALGQAQKLGVHRGGLYANFVSGGRIEGSIGSNPFPTPEDSEDVDEKHISDGKNVKMSNKRKREEREGTDKRARRKVDKSDDERLVNRRAKEIVTEAQQRGIIPERPNEDNRGSKSNSRNAITSSKPSDELVAVLKGAGIDVNQPVQVPASTKAQKYERMGLQREIKRAAKAYLTGESLNESRKHKKRKQDAEQRGLVVKDADMADFDHRADEIKLNPNSINILESTVGEEKTQQTSRTRQAAKLGVDLKKLEQYEERATAKGLGLDEYVRRRQAKKGQKHAEDAGQTAVEDLDFIIDATGDEKLESQVSDLAVQPIVLETIRDTRSHSDLTEVPNCRKATKASIPTNLATRAIKAITESRPFTIVDDVGNATLQWNPGTAVPPDPRIWEGMVVKELPKNVREARKRWMHLRRERRKGHASSGDNAARSKTRRIQKLESREKLVHAILHASRDALKQNGSWGGNADLDGREGVQLVKVKGTSGAFSKQEINLARTVARRRQREEKRADREAKGKGKGWKKKERSEKQASVEWGISARFQNGEV